MIPNYPVSGIYRTVRPWPWMLTPTTPLTEKSLLRLTPIKSEHDIFRYPIGTQVDVQWRGLLDAGRFSPLQSSFRAICRIISGPSLHAPMFFEMILPKTSIRFRIVKMEDQKSGIVGVMSIPELML